MSRNFELLQKAAREDLLTPSGIDLPLETNAPVLAAPVRTVVPEMAKLVQRLFFQAGNVNAPKVVSFSGMARDDRSSWVCARAGEALAAQVDASVCVVDANLWSPQLHAHVGSNNQAGLTDALTTKVPIRDFVTPLHSGNLWLIPSGFMKPNLYAAAERYHERFAELREIFNYVLISAPALTRETEATSIGQLADGVVLIIEANHNRREAARRVKEQLESAQVRLLGAVLDQCTFPIPESLYRKL